jgi:two-component system OmpR family response regulator
MIKVLLVDDDKELCAMQADYLSADGFEVSCAHDGEAGVAAALGEAGVAGARGDVPPGPFAIVVLDVMMPRLNGIDALRRIREKSSVPVIMLTARGDGIDRILGLEFGADDYVPKPCTPRELVARIRAILRRTEGGALARHDASSTLELGPLKLSPRQRQASWGEAPLDLTSAEFGLLELLARHAGESVSKENLCEHALGRSLTRYDRSIDVHVSNLRHKLGLLDDGRSPVQTVRGIGYQLIID